MKKTYQAKVHSRKNRSCKCPYTEEKNLPTKKTGLFRRIFKEEIIPILWKISQKIEEQEMLSNYFYTESALPCYQNQKMTLQGMNTIEPFS